MRHAVLRVWANSFIEFNKLGAKNIKVVENALPSDTRFIRAGHDDFGNLYLVVESKKFKNLKEGHLLPELPPVVFRKMRLYEKK